MTRWVVLVGPGATCESLLSTESLDVALRSVESLSLVAPALRTAIYFGSAVESVRALVIEDGIWRVTAPDSVQPSEQPVQMPAPRRSEAALEPCELTIGGGL